MQVHREKGSVATSRRAAKRVRRRAHRPGPSGSAGRGKERNI